MKYDSLLDVLNPGIDDSYQKFVAYYMSKFKGKIKIINNYLENNTIKLILMNTENEKTELIHLRNITFFKKDEVAKLLNDKIIKSNLVY